MKRVRVGRETATQVSTRQTKKLRVKSVTFRSSVQLKSFQHAHIEASADVPEGVNPSVVVEFLKEFVANELRVAKEGEVRPEPAGRFRV